MTQVQLGEYVGVSGSTIGRIESGRADAGGCVVAAIAAVLAVHPPEWDMDESDRSGVVRDLMAELARAVAVERRVRWALLLSDAGGAG